MLGKERISPSHGQDDETERIGTRVARKERNNPTLEKKREKRKRKRTQDNNLKGNGWRRAGNRAIEGDGSSDEMGGKTDSNQGQGERDDTWSKLLHSTAADDYYYNV